MSQWQVVGVVFEGEAINIDGVNPWKAGFHRNGEAPVQLPHPSHPNQFHWFNVFEAECNGNTVTFAAAELSAGVVGFYRRVAQQAVQLDGSS